MNEDLPQYLRDQAQLFWRRNKYVADCAVRYGSPQALTLLSIIASDGRHDYPELLAELTQLVASGTTVDAAPINTRALSGIARVKAAQPGAEYAEAAMLYQAVRLLKPGTAHDPEPKLSDDVDRLDVQSNLAAGNLAYVTDILPDLAIRDDLKWMIDTELHHPTRGLPGSTEDDWLERFNRVFEPFGIMPVTLMPGNGTPFDRLAPAATPRPYAGEMPLVTIVMSVYKPDESLITALRSLCGQTWTNLQILVVDDCSPEEFVPFIEKATSIDERIELHRMPVNGGTYKIRNYCLGIAQGEFLGFLDSDDWSHPERVERQAGPMIEDPTLVASLSKSIRAYSDFTLNKVGYSSLRSNASSLLFRIAPIKAELGRFDEVRKGGDSEFQERLVTIFGEERVPQSDEPLSIVQLTHGSLSRLDFSFGWRNPDRLAYRQDFAYWHQRIARGEQSGLLGEDRTRPFPAPRAFLRTEKDELRTDVLVVSDWRAGVGRFEAVADEVTALAGAGMSVAIAQAESMRFAVRARVPPSDQVMQLRADTTVSHASWEDPLRAEVVIVTDPELLCYPREADEVQIRSDRVVVRAGYPVRTPRGDALVYDPGVVESSARLLFGSDTTWQPSTQEVADSLVAAGATGTILSPRQYGAQQVLERRTDAPRRRARLTVGTAGLEKWPGDKATWVALMKRLPVGDVDVRVRDEHGVLAPTPSDGEVPRGWQVSAEPDLDTFLADLDVFVGCPRKSWGPELSYECVRAMIAGCVVVLNPAYESQFGEAALYTGSRTAGEIIERLSRRPKKLAQQRELAYAWCERNLAPADLVAAISALQP